MLPVVVGAIWFSYANKIIDEVNGYNTQSTILSSSESSRETLNYNLKAAAGGYIASDSNQMLASLEQLNPGYKVELNKVTSPHAPGTAELQASIVTYTAEAKKAVDLALSSAYTAEGVRAIIQNPAFKQADEEVALSIAAAHLGLAQATGRGNDNWKFVITAELVMTLFITVLAIVLSLVSERAIKRADESEQARHQDRINLATEPFTHVIATMDDGVLILSDDQKILHANLSAQALLGIGVTVGSTYNIPTDGRIEIRKTDGSTSVASATTSTAVAGGQSVTVLTIREN
ncbi:MAG: PAS domain-containing protein [Actinomycetota bacterium]|nr:PAS domain-containing protein [Actinomycetota bacterium]